LAVYGLTGAAEYRRVHGCSASDDLIAPLATLFAKIMAPRTRLYRSRQDEFGTLIDRPLDRARPLLDAATLALGRAGATANVSATFGMTFLPAEASDRLRR
jgi:hypothetical protein